MKMPLNNAVGPQVRQGKAAARRGLSALAALSLAGGLQSATQFFAHRFEYAAQLGGHVHHVYPPWSILEWSARWSARYPDELMRAASVGMMVATVGLLAVAIAKVVSSNSSRANAYLHGSARWAQRKDIEVAGLLPRRRTLRQRLTGEAPASSAGVYVGGWQAADGTFHYLRHNGPEHVLTYAPTRSGKGVGLVVPTLLSWGASAVVTDLKGELWALTAGWRKAHAGNAVLRFEPAAAEGSVCWNPLDEIRLATDHAVGDVQNLVTLLVDPNGKGLESHWQKTAFALLVGVLSRNRRNFRHPSSSPATSSSRSIILPSLWKV